jgi:pimeloyl-ACP methyl ester carboxylesterase
VAGVRLHWAELGNASDATPLVLLHGLNNSCLSWSRVAPLLASDRRILMPDLPGHGQSERPNVEYTLEWYARVMAAWLEALGLQQVDVIGHSFGGGVAQMLLLHCPERVRRLVLVAAGGLGRGVGRWLRLASLPYVVEYLGQPFMPLGTHLALRNVKKGVSKADILELSRLNAQPGSARAFARSVRNVINWRGQKHNFFQRAHEIQNLPALLIVWGDGDTIIPIEQGRALLARLKGAHFEAFEHCGHYPHNEHPERFAAAVRTFLDDPSVTAATLIGAGAVPAAGRQSTRRVTVR